MKEACQLYQYCHLHDCIDQIFLDRGKYEGIKQERFKNWTLWQSCNYTFPVTKSDAYSSALVLFGNITLQKNRGLWV